MINKKKNLLLLLGGIILILLIGIYIFISAYSKQKVAEETEESIEETILSIQPEDMKHISISQKGNEFSVTKEDSTWMSDQQSDIPILGTKVENLLSQVEELKYNKKITDVTDLEQYGLDDGNKITVDFQDEGDQVFSISFGEVNLSTKDCYVYLDDKTTVYTIDGSIRSAYDITLYDLIDSDTYPSISSSNIQRVSIKADEQTLVLTSNQENRTTYGVTLNDKPQREAASDKVNELYQTLTSISFEQCIDYQPASPGVYGLSDQSMEVSITYIDEDTDKETKEETVMDLETQIDSEVESEEQDDANIKTLRFRIGDYTEKAESAGKFYYVQLEDSPQIQLVSESSLTSLLDLSYNKLLNPVFTPINQRDVDYTLVTYEGQEYKLYSSKSTTMGDQREEDSEQDGDSTAETYYVNDTEVDSDFYQDFMTYAMTMNAESFLADNTETVTHLVLNITYVSEDGTLYPVSYYEYDSNYDLVKTDAGICLINKLNFSSMMTKLQALLPDQETGES
ncbi:MAG TPA: DUF4340 domain-containing protein [Candidatus Merdenecus merdavium]|nr:DUF4340 domain-containing protein [Candidatus Merdenecus merdavium]